MRKLFSGKFRGIPVGVLVSVLLALMVMGGVVAAVTGYTLWTGTVDINVAESIHIWYGSDGVNYPDELVLGADMPAMDILPGDCEATYFKITSDSPGGVLVKAAVVPSDPVVTHSFSDPDIEGAGIEIDSSATLYIVRYVCVAGDAPIGTYTVTTTFTRESVPVP